MNIVVDASIAIKWFIPEIYWEHAAKLQHQADLFAPDFMLLECANILTKKVRRNEIERELANQIQNALDIAPIQYIPWQDFTNQATQIAHDTNRSVYDCLYLAIAHQLNGKMITADKKLTDSLKTHSDWQHHLLWIEDL